jgi:hypothetical protein
MSLRDRILLTLYYLRHYPIFQNLADVFNISESCCYKIHKRYSRIVAKIAKLPNRKELLDKSGDTLIIDVSEQPTERPVKHQKYYYSGKKKRHAIKAQITASAETGQILSVVCEKGKQHDFTVFKESDILIHTDSTVLADSGYQGIQKYHKNSMIPIKKKRELNVQRKIKHTTKNYQKKRIFYEYLSIIIILNCQFKKTLPFLY